MMKENAGRRANLSASAGALLRVAVFSWAAASLSSLGKRPGPGLTLQARPPFFSDAALRLQCAAL
jgi:hypothetical protein